MEYLLALSILANVAIPIVLTHFHQREKRDLHDRLMARSPDEYIYNTQVAPMEIESLEREFKGEKPQEVSLSPHQKAVKESF